MDRSTVGSWHAVELHYIAIFYFAAMDLLQIADVAKKEKREIIEWLQQRELLKRRVCMGCFSLPNKFCQDHNGSVGKAFSRFEQLVDSSFSLCACIHLKLRSSSELHSSEI